MPRGRPIGSKTTGIRIALTEEVMNMLNNQANAEHISSTTYASLLLSKAVFDKAYGTKPQS